MSRCTAGRCRDCGIALSNMGQTVGFKTAYCWSCNGFDPVSQRIIESIRRANRKLLAESEQA